MIRHITVSAPSKVILHGEHAVVYGKSAVAASLDLRTRMFLTPILKENVLQVDFQDVGVKRSWTGKVIRDQVLSFKPSIPAEGCEEVNQDFLKKIQAFVDQEEVTDDLQKASLTCFFYLYAIICDKFLPMSIRVESEIPLGAGLGSSAALSVCLSAGLTAIKTTQSELNEEMLRKICNFAFISEQILHGRPSGIDNFVSTYGGFVHFKLGQISPIKPPENFNLRILLVNTKVPRQTKDLVGKVREQYYKHPTIIEPILDSIDGVSLRFLETIKEMDSDGDSQEKYQDLNQFISYNHDLLRTIGVSHPSLEEVLNIAKSFGLHAKLTGAGGGGFAFVLLPPFIKESLVQNVQEKLAKKGFDCREANLGVNGVRVQFDNCSTDHECISQ